LLSSSPAGLLTTPRIPRGVEGRKVTMMLGSQEQNPMMLEMANGYAQEVVEKANGTRIPLGRCVRRPDLRAQHSHPWISDVGDGTFLCRLTEMSICLLAASGPPFDSDCGPAATTSRSAAWNSIVIIHLLGQATDGWLATLPGIASWRIPPFLLGTYRPDSDGFGCADRIFVFNVSWMRYL
jgi:hypothetical protein